MKWISLFIIRFFTIRLNINRGYINKHVFGFVIRITKDQRVRDAIQYL